MTVLSKTRYLHADTQDDIRSGYGYHVVSVCGGEVEVEVEGTASDNGGDNDWHCEYSHIGKGSRGRRGALTHSHLSLKSSLTIASDVALMW